MEEPATNLEPRFVNARTAAQVLGVSVFTVRRLAREGSLRSRRFGRNGAWRFRIEDLEEFVSGPADGRAAEAEAR